VTWPSLTGAVRAVRSPARADHAPEPALLVGYLIGVAVGEWLLSVSVPAAAAWFGLVTLAACLAPLAVPGGAAAAAVPVLLAIPVTRLVTLAAPTADASPPGRLVLLAGFTLVGVAVVAVQRPRTWRLLRPGPGGWAAQAPVPLVAAPLAVAVYLLAPPAPGLGAGVPLAVLATALALSVIPDELLFRGLLVPAAAGVAGPPGVWLAATAYAATFIGYGSVTVIMAAFAVGCVLGWYRERTGSAAGVLAARILLVLLVYLVLPAV
jgi:hypothetical protein